MKYIDQVKAARRASVPTLVIRTPDPTVTVSSIAKEIGGKTPILQWDIAQGIVGVNPEGQNAANIINEGQEGAVMTANPQEALSRALNLMPEKCMLFLHNSHLLLETKDDGNRMTIIQGIANTRDAFKVSNRTLVLLCPDIKVPMELINDVVVIDVELPGEAEMKEIVLDLHKASGLPEPDAAGILACTDAVSGLSHFLAENSIAMSLRKDGVDLDSLWLSKIKSINAVGGLTVSTQESSFDNLGGLEGVKAFGKMKISGKKKPKLIVLLDEVEKQMAGLGDSNGINQDCFGQILSNMQDNSWDGMLLPGFPGTGKTEFGKAMGKEAGGLFLSLDLGGTKGGIVGDSEKMIRSAMNILKAMGGERVFFIATCNSMESLRPELKRRFSVTYFFDLLTKAQQAPIWSIYQKKFNLGDQELPEHKDWTGAEIRKCCILSDEFGIPITEAAKFISPVAKMMGGDVQKLRESADGKYLDANSGGFFQSKSAPTPKSMVRGIGKN